MVDLTACRYGAVRFIIEAARCQGLPLMLVGTPGRPTGGGKAALLRPARALQRRRAHSTFDVPPLVAVRAQTDSGRWSRLR
jgi:hypothetical protein